MPPSIFVTGLVAILGLPVVILAAAQGLVPGLIALAIVGSAVAAAAYGTLARIDADADGLTYVSGFRRSRVPWSRVAAFHIREVRGAGLEWYEIDAGGGQGMRFTSRWANAERVAACIQRRGLTDAGVDRAGRTEFDPDRT